MSWIGRMWLRTLLVITVSILSSASARGAELRTSAGGRAVQRTVAVTPTKPRAGSVVLKQEELIADEVIDTYGEFAHDHGEDCQTCPDRCFQVCGVWANVDFLLGWRHGVRFPPLVTTSPAGTAQAAAGVLGQPTTTVLYPTEPVGEEARPGGRIAVGMWLDPWQCWGVEGRYFMLADEHTQFSATSTGDPILARPFFDVANGAQASRLLAFPGVVTPGNVSVTTESQIHGGDALLRRALCKWGRGRIDLLIGYQFSRIDESLVISDSSTDANPGNLIADGTVLAITDNFATRNEYHAAAVGAAAQYEQGSWRVDVLGKIGFGNMRETVFISGQTTVDTPPIGVIDTTQTFGLLAQGVNLGTFSQDQFTVSPEINAKFVYHVSDRIDFTAGYTLLYWSALAQPGRQIDLDLRVPTDRFTIRDSEFWVHAATVGAQVTF